MHVLVAVASRHGSTREIADAVAETLRDAGHTTDVLDPEDVEELAHDAVVLGSSVYVGRWSAGARAFADRLAVLRDGRPVWLFSSGPVGRRPVPADDPEEVPSLVERLGARGHRTFAGRLDRGGLGLAERAVVSLVKAPQGDFRAWDDVRTWAEGIARDLHEDEIRSLRSGPLPRA
ncbi:flavodoxin domain-containing protein [Actinotalea ferrariae]|nr:flavodoxin domain-containing protein [Actinotalea ferrariae]